MSKMMICKCGHTTSLEVKTFCCDLRCPNYRPDDIGDCLNLIPYVEPQQEYECTDPHGVCYEGCDAEVNPCPYWQPKKPATKISRDARFRSMERFLSPTLNLGERLPPQPEEPAGLKPEPKCNASFCNSKMNGYCTTPNECGFKVKPEPTCPECGHTIASHCKAGCCAEGIAGAFCDCLKAPADLQPEKHCTDSRSLEDIEHCCGEQPTPTMPLRGKLVSITYCGDCPHNDMCVSGKASYPYCNAPTPNRKFIENGVDARAGGIPSWCPLSDAEAHDSEVASKEVKEFAEKVIVRISGYKCDHSKLTESQQTVNWWLDRAIESIREMAEKE